MKKFLVFALLIFPMTVFAAPSVRMLGSKANTNVVPQSESKVTPTKNTSGASSARIGTLRTNTKITSNNAGAITSSSSRFPVITPAHAYNSVISPGTNSNNAGASTAGVDVAAIESAIKDAKDEIKTEMASDYYQKDSEEFKEAVRAAIEDDPRFDAVRLIDPASATNRRGQTFPSSPDAGDGYVYIWIEK